MNRGQSENFCVPWKVILPFTSTERGGELYSFVKLALAIAICRVSGSSEAAFCVLKFISASGATSIRTEDGGRPTQLLRVSVRLEPTLTIGQALAGISESTEQPINEIDGNETFSSASGRVVLAIHAELDRQGSQDKHGLTRDAASPGAAQISVAPTRPRLEISCQQEKGDNTDNRGLRWLLRHTATILKTIIRSDRNETLHYIDSLDSDEQILVRDIWPCQKVSRSISSDTSASLSDFESVQMQIARRAQIHPKKIALQTAEGSCMTYAKLFKQAQLLASLCAAELSSTERASPIPLALDQDIPLYVSILAVLMLGSAYVPLDLESPAARNQLILNQINPRIILTSSKQSDSLQALLNESGARAILVDQLLQLPAANESTFTSGARGFHLTDSSDLAYILFTSGTTGTPKGIRVDHGNLFHSIRGARSMVNAYHSLRTLAFSAPAFDMSVWDLFGTLTSGGTICVATKPQMLQDITSMCDTFAATFLQSTSTVLNLIDPARVPFLHVILPGGEPLSFSVQKKFAQDFDLYNTYGPSEITVSAVSAKIGPLSSRKTIGQPLGSNKVYIVQESTAVTDHLNSPLKLCGVSEVGEIALAGPQVAQGYLHLPELSASKFITNPFATGERMFLSGDLGRWSPEGLVLLEGRKDHQVKIRGHRVELASITAVALAATEEVQNAACIKVETDRVEALALFISPFPDIISMAEDDLPQCLQGNYQNAANAIFERCGLQLPLYAVPSFVFPLEVIPSTANNKLDERKIASIYSDIVAKNLERHFRRSAHETSGQDQTSPLEETVAALWESVLPSDLPALRLPLDQHFFAAGGTSMHVIKLSAAARQSGYNLSVADIFANPTVRAQARVLVRESESLRTDLSGAEESLAPFGLVKGWSDFAKDGLNEVDLSVNEVEEAMPATRTQESLISISLRNTRHGGRYMARMTVPIPEWVSVERFKEAWKQLVSVTPILRTAFVLQGDQLLQLVLKTSSAQVQQLVSLTGKSNYNSCVNLQLKLGQCPVATELDIASDKADFHLTLHHSVYDGELLRLLSARLTKLCRTPGNVLQGRPYSLFVHRLLKFRDNEESISYWKRYLFDCQAFTWPTEMVAKAGATSKVERQNSCRETQLVFEGALRSKAQEHCVTTATLFKTALSMVLHASSGANDIIYSLVSSGRSGMAGRADLQDVLGPCVTTVPVRAVIAPGQTVMELLTQLDADGAAALAHEHVGYAKICGEANLRPAMALSTVLLTFQDQPPTLSAQEFNLFDAATEMEVEFPINLVVDQRDEGLLMSVYSHDEEVSAQLVTFFLQRISVVLSSMCSSDLRGLTVNDLPCMGEEELRYLRTTLCKASAATSTIKAYEPVHLSFQARAQQIPKKIAIMSLDGETITYDRLNHLSSQLSVKLAARISSSKDSKRLVAIFMPKCIELYIVIFAVLKAGYGYVAFEPDHPPSRTRQLLSHIQASLLIVAEGTQSRVDSILTKNGVATSDGNVTSPLFNADRAIRECDIEDTGPEADISKAIAIKEHDTAYIVFTSGTTNSPKPIVVQHGNLYHSIESSRSVLHKDPSSLRTLAFSGPAFDMSVWDLFGTLCIGGTLCIASRNDLLSNLSGVTARLAVTFIETTSTVLDLLEPDQVPFLLTLCPGGEPLKKQICERFSTGFQILNTYGPSECTVSVTSGCIGKDDLPSLIGRPIGCNRAYVMDRCSGGPPALLPLGRVGELAFGGPQVGPGYLGNQQATSASFIPDPFDVDAPTSQRLFLTGDKARWHSDGRLEYLGRSDFQIKVRGFRIDPFEVEEAVLKAAYPVGGDAICVKVLDDESRERLVVFVALSNKANNQTDCASSTGLTLTGTITKDAPAFTASLSSALRQSLPSHMIPSVIFPMKAFPLTANLKVDRKALMAKYIEWGDSESKITFIDAHPVQQSEVSELSLSETEIQVATLWGQLLGREPSSFSSNDHFLLVGGDSVLVIRLAGLYRARRCKIDFATLFDNLILSDQASLFLPSQTKSVDEREAQEAYRPFSLLQDAVATTADVIAGLNAEPEDVVDVLPCSPMQDALVGLSLAGDRYTEDYSATIDTELPKTLTFSEVHRAWNQLVQWNDVLRTSFFFGKEGLLQVVYGSESTRGKAAYLQKIDSKNAAASSSDSTTFDMIPAPSIEMGAVPIAARFYSSTEKSRLVVKLHHAVYDGEMLDILLHQFYSVLRSERSSLSGPLRYSYALFVRWLQGQHHERQVAFWSEHLQGCSPCRWPPVAENLDDPTLLSGTVQSTERAILTWQGDISSLASHYSVLPIALIQLALAVVLKRYTAEDDILFSMVSSGRSGLEMEGLDKVAGPCITTFPVRVKVKEDQLVNHSLAALMKDLQHSLKHEHLGMHKIKELMGVRRRGPLTNVILTYQAQVDRPKAHGKDTDMFDIFGGEVRMTMDTPINLIVSPTSEGLELSCFFHTSTVEASRVHWFLKHVTTILESLKPMVTNTSSRTLFNLRMLDNEEHAQLLDYSNDASIGSASNQAEGVLQTFKRQVDQTPKKIAIQHGILNFVTYAELDSWSDRLASEFQRQLRLRNDPSRQRLIALLLERGPGLVAALLATQKAGAAYVALDEDFNHTRARDIIATSAPILLLTSKQQRNRAGSLLSNSAFAVELLTIEEMGASAHANLGEHPPATEAIRSGSDLAYVVFTSGTSGKPKGICVEKRNLDYSIQACMSVMPKGSSSRTLCFSGPSFDMSVWDLFGTLCTGGTLCTLSKLNWLEDLGGMATQLVCTFLETTSTVLDLIEPAAVPFLQYILPGGEPLGRSIQRKFSDDSYLLNTYGPSEATVSVSSGRLYQNDPANVIGKPVGSNAIYVVKSHTQRNGQDSRPQLNLCSFYEPGELAIAGPQISRGYLNMTELTSKSFIENCELESQVLPTRLFLSGDFGYWDSDGRLHLLGRIDSQVKIKGYRVELGDIESTILTAFLGTIRQVACIKTTFDSRESIVAFVVRNGNEVSMRQYELGEAVRESIVNVLPAYMVPSMVLTVNSIPMTQNSKIDRIKLTELHRKAATERPLMAHKKLAVNTPRNHLEKRIVKVWSEHLGIDPQSLDIDKHFVSLGADSLTAMKVARSLISDGLRVSVGTLFRQPTVRNLAAALQEPQTQADEALVASVPDYTPFSMIQTKPEDIFEGSDVVDRDDIEDIFPCSAFQEGLIASTLVRPEQQAFFANLRIRVGEVTPECLERFWSIIQERHPMLRTVFKAHEDSLLHVVLRPTSKLLNRMKDRQPQVAFRAELLGECQHWILPSYCRHPDRPREMLVLLRIHHALYDGAMLRGILHDFGELLSGVIFTRPLLPFSHFLWCKKKTHRLLKGNSSQFWASLLSGMGDQKWPPRALSGTKRLAVRRKNVCWKGDLQTICAKNRVTIATILQVVISIIVARNSGQKSVVIGVVTSGRSGHVDRISANTIIDGPSIANVPLRVTVQEADILQSLFEKAQINHQETLEHEVPSLEEMRKITGSMVNAGLSELLFVFHDFEDSSEQICHASKACELEEQPQDQLMMLDNRLTVEAFLQDEGLSIECAYLLDGTKTESELDCFADKIVVALDALADLSPILRVCDLSTLSPSEALLTSIWSRRDIEAQCRAQPLMQFDNVALAFMSQAATLPRKIALQYKEIQFVSYAELSAKAAKVKNMLTMERSRFVAVCIDTSPVMIAVMLGILLSGKAYVPIDPEHPGGRSRAVLEECRPGLLFCGISQQTLCEGLVDENIDLTVLDCDANVVSQQSASRHRMENPASDNQNVAYVMFTSGTTGKPKGIVTEHKAVLHSIVASDGFDRVKGKGLRTVPMGSCTFDMIVWDIWMPLLTGGTVCVAPRTFVVESLDTIFGAVNATLIQGTPSLLAHIDPGHCFYLQNVLSTGEPLTQTVRDAFGQQNQIVLINSYGPTETTVYATNHQVQPWSDPRNIGRPLGAYSAHIMSGNRTCGLGEPGELIFSGPQLAKAYYGKLSSHCDRFVQSFGEFKQRAFRTGDVASWLPNGDILLLGRTDDQVKVRGYRIELQEVEVQIRSSSADPSISVVCLKATAPSGQDCLVAFVRSKSLDGLHAAPSSTSAALMRGRGELSNASLLALPSNDFAGYVDRLKKELQKRLPNYMIPTSFIELERMPLNVNGKVDRTTLLGLFRQLHEAGADRQWLNQSSSASRAAKMDTNDGPEHRLEGVLRKGIREILKVEASPGLEESFLSLGGDSILALRLSAFLRSESIRIAASRIISLPTLKEVLIASIESFNEPTISPNGTVELRDDRSSTTTTSTRPEPSQALAQEIVRRISDCGPCDIDQVLPCAPMQEGLVSIGLAESSEGLYVSSMRGTLAAWVDLRRFAVAWKKLVHFHDILRTVFASTEAGIRQVVLKKESAQSKLVETITTVSSESLVPPLYFKEGVPLCQAHFVRNTATTKTLLIIQMHHAIFDGTTLNVFSQDLASLYHRPEKSLPKEPSYASFVDAVRSDLDSSDTFWREKLRHYVKLDWPPSELRRLAQSELAGVDSEPAAPKVVEVDWSCDPRAMCCALEVSRPALILAGLALTYHLFQGTESVMVGIISSGRDSINQLDVSRVAGPCASIAPLGIKVSRSDTIRTLAQNVQAEMIAIGRHSHVGLGRIQSLAGSSKTRLFDVTFVYQGLASAATDDVDDLPVDLMDMNTTMAFEMLCSIAATPNSDLSTNLKASVRSPCLVESTRLCLSHASRLLTLFVRAFEQGDLDQLVSQLYLPPSNEIAPTTSSTDHQSSGKLTETTSLIEAFSFQVQRTPKKIALQILPDSFMTFAELQHSSSYIADRLHREALRRPPSASGQEVFAIMMEKSFEHYATVLAVGKSGQAFCPFDSSVPVERNQQMMEDLGCRLVICTQDTLKAAQSLASRVGAQTYCVEDWKTSRMRSNQQHTETQPFNYAAMDLSDLFCVLFTSGTTGRPKGVRITNKMLLHSVQGMYDLFPLGHTWRQLAVFNLTFDGSLSDFFLPMLHGATLTLVTKSVWLEQATQIAAESLSQVILGTPTLLSLIKSHDAASWLQLVASGGEPLDLKTQKQLSSEHCHLYNIYGPSETGVSVVGGEVFVSSRLDVIGYPYGTSRIYILDEAGRPCDKGIPGQLFVSGPQVSPGYIGREDLTSQRFSKDPFAPAEMMYATGDLGYWLDNGTIALKGRTDSQVKLRGHRIEVTEIEQMVTDMFETDCFGSVACIKVSLRQQEQLVILLTSDEDTSTNLEHSQSSEHAALATALPDEETRKLRYGLSAKLPKYMVPTFYLQVRRFPTTTNGKIDRVRLTEIASTFISSDSHAKRRIRVAPRSDVERKLVSLLARILQLDELSISVDDDFIELGLDSLRSAAFSAAAQNIGIAVRVTDVFSQPTVQALAQSIDSTINNVTDDEHQVHPGSMQLPRTPANIQSEVEAWLPCTSMQEIMVLSTLSATNPSGSRVDQPYQAHISFELASWINLDRLIAAWESMTQEHLILRAGFAVAEQCVWMMVLKRQSRLVNSLQRFHVEDLETWARTWKDQHRFVEYTHALAPALVTTRQGSRYLSLILHHGLYDGTSIQIIIEQLSELVRGSSCMVLQKGSLDFASIARQIRQQDTSQESRDFWRDRLRSVRQLQWPCLTGDSSSTSQQTRSEAAHVQVRCQIDLQSWCRTHRVTSSSLIHLAFAWVLSTYTGSPDVVFGSISSGRGSLRGAEKVIGPCITHIPSAFSLHRTENVEVLLQRSHKRLVECRAHEHVRLSTILQQLDGDLQGVLPYGVLLVVQEDYTASSEDSLIRNGLQSTMNYDVHVLVEVFSRQDKLEIQVKVAHSVLHPALTADALANHLQQAINTLVSSSAKITSSLFRGLSFLGERERQKLVKAPEPIPRMPTSVLDLFNRNVKAFPKKTALYSDKGRDCWTYAELDAASAEIATALSKQWGVVEGEAVAFLLPKDSSAILVIFAILRAGCTYVALDKRHPAQRLSHAIRASGARIVVVDETTRPAADHLKPSVVTVSDLIRSKTARYFGGATQSHCNGMVQGVQPESSAYILFTSGTTGRPKGVIVSHSNLVHYVLSKSGSAKSNSFSRRYAFASWTFDVSVGDIFSTLCSGACLCLDSENDMFSGLGACLQNCSATAVDLTPTVAYLIQGCHLPFLDRICLSGEPLPKRLARSLCLDYQLVNTCGPTETVVQAMAQELSRHELEALPFVPLGRPTGDTVIYIAEPCTMKLLPMGSVGEMLIGGGQVTKGYIGEPDLTRERYVQDEFTTCSSKGMLFRSGDLGRVHLDGTIEHLGRLDRQVKLHGLRIELGEIESTLTSFTEVSICHAMLINLNKTDRLVALAVTANQDADLWTSLEERVSAYMLPWAIVVFQGVADLPRTSSGKIDTSALTEGLQSNSIQGASIQYQDKTRYGSVSDQQHNFGAQDELEQEVIVAWSKVLDIAPESIGSNVPFARLGGDSISSMKLLATLRHGGQCDLLISDVDGRSTVRSQAASWRSRVRTSCISALRVRTDGPLKKAVLVLVHDYTGTIFDYQRLCPHLHESMDVFAIMDPCIGTLPAETSESIESIARIYTNEVSRLALDQKYERFVIGGWSLGGVIATEMTRHMSFHSLVIFDSLCPGLESVTDAKHQETAATPPDQDNRLSRAIQLQTRYRDAPGLAMPTLLVSADNGSDSSRTMNEKAWLGLHKKPERLQVERTSLGHNQLFSTVKHLRWISGLVNSFMGCI